MIDQEVKNIIINDLPQLFEQDIQVRESILRLFMPTFAPRVEVESRFDRMMNELQRMREDFEQK